MTIEGNSIMARRYYYYYLFGTIYAYSTQPQNGQYWSLGIYVRGNSPRGYPELNGAPQISGVGPTAGITAPNVVAGIIYKIDYSGTTDWKAIGSKSNEVGTLFKATQAGSGTGSATALPVITAAKFETMRIAAVTEHGRWPLGGLGGAGDAVGVGGKITIALFNAIIDAITGLNGYATEYTYDNGTGAGDAGPFGGTGAGYNIPWNDAVQPWGYTSFPAQTVPNTGIPAKAVTGTKITAAAVNALIGAINSDSAVCTCNCNYCTCNCNYCTCNCNYSCTCNCNYSDERVKTNIEYM